MTDNAPEMPAELQPINIAVLTVSDTRTEDSATVPVKHSLRASPRLGTCWWKKFLCPTTNISFGSSCHVGSQTNKRSGVRRASSMQNKAFQFVSEIAARCAWRSPCERNRITLATVCPRRRRTVGSTSAATIPNPPPNHAGNCCRCPNTAICSSAQNTTIPHGAAARWQRRV